ncbi:MAG: amino acid adenylation domain-containing protein [Spirulina sp.]
MITPPSTIVPPLGLEILDRSIPQRFQEQVLRDGDRLAIQDGARSLTYYELNCLANQIARNILEKRGVGAEPIAILLATGIEAIAAMLGVLKAGKFYVPLDITWPESRLNSILADSQAKLILSDRQQAENLALNRIEGEIFWLDTRDRQTCEDNLDIQSSPEDLAYILYTSGSSGRPKGVMQTHRYVLNLYRNYSNSGEMTASDRFSLLYSAAFGGAVRDIYCALLNGAALFPLDVKQIGLHQLGGWLRENEITVMFAVATLFRHFAATLQGRGHFPNLRLIQIGSETVYRQDAELFQQHFNDQCTLMVNLGGTEISPVRQFPITRQTVLTGSTVPAGYAVEGTEVLLWDESGKEVLPGEVGEIVVCSDRVASGYWQQPELTERVFIRDENFTYFKTGDLGRFLSDGCLLHLGRKDFQVKIRGYRVEIGEVESVLLGLESVREAVVVAKTDEGGIVRDRQLVAYLTPTHPHNKPTINALKEILAERLPDYAIPATFLWLESLPLTATGKIDRRSLPQPPSLFPSDLEIVPPRTPTEEKLTQIWLEVLNLPEIGRENNFFDLGGNSLHASQILARIAERFAIDLPLKTIFDAPAIAQFAEYLDSAKTGTSLPPLVPIQTPNGSKISLSLAQKRLWFLDRLETHKSLYNLFRGFRLRGQIDVSCLERAIQEIIARHDILRTTFAEVDGIPVQAIAPSLPFNLDILNLQDFPATEQTTKLEEIVTEIRNWTFDLTQPPLLKCLLIHLSDREHHLFITMHHIISDDWSIQVFLKEISLFYGAFLQDFSSPLPPLPVQYTDYTHWQQQYLAGEVLEDQLAYWRSQLADAPPLLDLPTDFPRTSEPSFQGGIVPVTLDREIVQNLKALSRRSQTTLFVTLLTAFAILLSRYSNQEDLIIGTAIANRNPVITEKLIGFFVSTLSLRIQIPDNPTFLNLLHQVQQTTLEAHTRADVPFDRLVESLSVERYSSHNPLFQVLFVLQNTPQESLTFPKIEAEPLNFAQPTAGATFDLTLSLKEAAEGTMQGTLEYNTRLFQPESIDRMAGHFQTLLKAIAETPECPVGFLPLLEERERELLVMSQPEITAPSDRCLHEWFAWQADKTPDAIAARCEERQLTYKELNERANQLAHYLQGLGVKPDTLVGLCVERSLETLIGILGILKAGGAYVPLDPANPQARLDYIARDSQIEIWVTQSELAAKISHCREILRLDADWEKIAEQSSHNPESEATSRNLTYVIYTSGSTGQPKGVLVTHENVVRLFTATESWYGFKETDIWTLFHSYAFDFSVWEMWGALLYGGRLIVVPYWTSRDTSAFYKLLASEGVTVLNQTPSAFYQLIEADDVGRANLNLRWVIFGGEALDLSALAPWFQRHGDRQPQLVNMYGITETTVHVTYRPLSLADLNIAHSPIGIPIPDLQIYLLDRHLQPVPQGVRGEMYIGGGGVTRGYLNREDLTRDRFIDHPFDETSGKLYKTGDLARYLPNGELVYLGRIDNQVKIRGFRIELGEIEAILSQHSAIRESAVQVRRDRTGDPQIVAYVVPDRQQTFPLLKLAELRAKGELTDRNLYEFPNGMTIAHLNRSESEFLYQEIFSEQSYLQHGIAIAPGDCIFDVGANIGLFTLFAAQICPDIEVYAFEPIPPIFDCLRFNTELYNLNVKLFNCGLAKETQQVEFTYYPHLSAISGQFADLGEEKETVKSFLLNQQSRELARSPESLEELLTERLQSQQLTGQLRTLSEIIRDRGIERIDLLKIDVEKSEGDVLAGIQAKDWLKIEQLVIEVHDLEGRLQDITDLLKGQGYELNIVQDPLLADTPLYNIYARRPSPQQSPVENRDRPSLQLPWSSLTRFKGEIRHDLQEKLPEYAIPSAIAVLEQFPLTANGKIDFRALPDRDREENQEIAFISPRTPTETAIAQIFASILKRERIGVGDNFFHLGGHSLLATQAISRISQHFAIEIPLKILFEHPVLADLARVVDGARENPQTSLPLIQPIPRNESLALSFAQQRLWFLHRLEGARSSYNIASAFKLAGNLNRVALEQSLGAIASRHESLRTTFESDRDGIPYQQINPPETISLPAIAVSEGEHIENAIQSEIQQPFDLTRDRLIRCQLLQLSPTLHILLVTIHHIVADGWSMGIFRREISQLYRAFSRGLPSPLSPLTIQYADFAHWQRQWLSDRVLETQLSYWQQQLAGIPPLLNLPTDYPRPAIPTLQCRRERFQFDPTLSQQLKALSQKAGCTLFMTLLAAFQVLLSRYARETDIVVGSPIANRNHAEVEPLIGFFVNTLVLRTDLSGNPSFQDFLQQVKQTTLAAYNHQDLPFEKLVEELQPERRLDCHPVVQVVLAFQNMPMADLELLDLKVDSLELEMGTTRELDLELHLYDDPRGLQGFCLYSTDLFTSETIRRMLGHFQTLLRAIVEDSTQTIDKLPLLTSAERQQILGEWNQTRRDYPAKCAHQLFEEWVQREPEAIAAVFGERSLTYEQLNRRANQLARSLRQRGVDSEILVGLCVERSLEMLVGLLGILKAGGGYVPLDPNYPPERLGYMLEDSGITVLLTQRSLRDHLSRQLPIARNLQTIDLDGEENPIASESPENLDLNLDLDRVAYVIYTSGSTGKPKGVAIAHRGLGNLACAHREIFDVRPTSRVLQFASLSFDASVSEIFMALASGARLVLMPAPLLGADLHRVLDRQGITHVTLPPSVLKILSPAGLPALQQVISAGEACPEDVARVWSQERRFFNAYGPSESTVCATVTEIQSHRGGIPAIGRAIANTQTYILDENLQPVPIGVPGELHLAGIQLARGYLNRPELTSQKFIENPFGSGRLYKTGDLARYRRDGNIEFLGRIDRQVKLRGFRIELGEIESVLGQHPAIAQNCLTVWQNASGEKSLAAYFVLDQTGEAIAEAIARAETELLEDWQALYEQSEDRKSEELELDFNIAGWNSSYSGEPIPAMEMQEWVETTVARIQAYCPQSVLEIGCGSGLLLSRIAPHCQRYYGTDYARPVLDHAKRLQQTQPSLERVVLQHKLAHDFEGIAKGEFDTVILNSVVQYFPSIHYLLRVLEGAIAAIGSKGRIFVGDVRNLSLLDAFHTFVQWMRSEGGTTLQQLQNNRQRSLKAEKELAIDPHFFIALAHHFPQIHRVEIQPKRGKFANELTQFRYDVTLHIESSQKEPIDIPWQDWQQESWTLAAIHRTLQEETPKSLGIRRIPNARIQEALQVQQSLEHSPAKIKTVAQLQAWLSHPRDGGVEPDVFWQLGEELGYRVQVSWWEGRATGCYDVAFIRQDLASPDAIASFWQPHQILQRPWQEYANLPLQNKLTQALIPEVRQFLQERLPEYMIPQQFVVLDRLPLTPNGKVDRNALPAPDLEQLRDRDFLAPETPIQKTLADIWQEILKIEPIGLGDNFFKLGGDSLLSIQLVAQASQAGIAITAQQILQYQTLEELSHVAIAGVARSMLSSPSSPVHTGSPPIAIQPQGDRCPLFFIHPVGGTVSYYVPLAHQLGLNQPFYGLQSVGFNGEVSPPDSIPAMASLYIEHLQRIQPQGPYQLGGWSMGGLIAFEMARQLRSAGQEAIGLFIVDVGCSQTKSRFLPDTTREIVLFVQILSDNIGRQSPLSEGQLQETMPEKQMDYVFELARTHQLIPREMDFQQFYRLFRVFQTNLRAIATYIPQPYSGSLVLFKATTQADYLKTLGSTYGWDRFVSGKITTHSVEGDHLSIVRNPQLAQLMQRYLI